MTQYKTTSFSAKERDFVLANGAKLSVEKIAQELSRKPESVAKWMKKQGLRPIWANIEEPTSPNKASDKLSIRQELRMSSTWKRLKGKFTDDEILYFEDKYVALLSQFEDDVLATEENQIHKLITYDILMDRNLIERKNILNSIQSLKDEFEKLTKKCDGKPEDLCEQDKSRFYTIDSLIAGNREIDRSMTKEYTDLESKHQSLMKDLKGTREQRISKIESSKTTFIGLLKNLQDEEIRKSEGLKATLMDRATKKEYERLAKPHRYIDGNEDQPILSVESVNFLEELHKTGENNEN